MKDTIFTPLSPCPVCEKRSGTALGQITYALFNDLDIPGTKTLMGCSECGMIYDDVAFTEEQLQEYYRRNEHYAVASMGGGGVSEDNNERYDRIIDGLNPDQDDLILDYGCGQGGFVIRCCQRGLKAVGIEPSTKSRKFARSSGIQVYESMDAFITENQAGSVRMVVFSHVLEHVINPMHLVRMSKHYAEDALIYIEVPDADSYLSPRSVRWEEMYFEHLCHFRKEHLQELARRSGIKIIKEERIGFSKYLEDTRCLVLLGRFSGRLNETNEFNMADVYPILTLPSLSVKLIPDDRPLALWGVSQYAMLLLGSCPELKGRVNRLFDASPAKIGRSINGIIIESSENLWTLSDDVNLLIPKSKFLTQMRNQLLESGFMGTVRVI